MTRDDELRLLALHMAGEPGEEWGALLADGTLKRTPLTQHERKELKYLVSLGISRAWALASFNRPPQIFKSPSDIKVGQPVLLRIRPHGDYCGCDSHYSAWL